jgi:hypothetical protein
VSNNHISNSKICEITVIKLNIKKIALDTRKTNSQMVSTIMYNISEDTVVTLGNLSYIKHNIRNYRHRKFPDEPLNANFCLPDEWTTTMGAELKLFLIFDYKQADSRILIFASNFASNILSYAETWFMDGTFKCSTTIFQQIYVIREKYKNKISTCLYAFLPNKVKSTYITILQQVIINCLQTSNNPKPKYIMIDFKIGAICATKHVFDDSVQIKGCFFHLCQSMWRKIQHLRLSSVYKNYKNIRMNCDMINALAFLLHSEVSSGMAYLYTIIPIELLPVAKYFDDIYVSGTYVTSMFSPILWNVFDVILNGGERTNNYCEGWNNYFNKLVGTGNPSFWLVL